MRGLYGDIDSAGEEKSIHHHNERNQMRLGVERCLIDWRDFNLIEFTSILPCNLFLWQRRGSVLFRKIPN